MEKNFHIAMHSNSENVHLKLFGDFDGTSASELNRVIESLCEDANKIFVHTESIEHFNNSNMDALESIQNDKLVFTGRYADSFTVSPHV